MEASIRRLGYGQLLFVVLLSIMVMTRPDVYFGNDGVSQYALLPSTSALFNIAFLSAAASMWVAANCLLPSAAPPLLRAGGHSRFDVALNRVLRLSAVLTVGLVVFPAIGNGLVDHIHIGFAVALFAIESLLAIYLTVRAGAGAVNLMLLAILIVTALISLLALLHVLHCKTQAEVGFQLAFNLLFLRLLRGRCVVPTQEPTS